MKEGVDRAVTELVKQIFNDTGERCQTLREQLCEDFRQRVQDVDAGLRAEHLGISERLSTAECRIDEVTERSKATETRLDDIKKACESQIQKLQESIVLMEKGEALQLVFQGSCQKKMDSLEMRMKATQEQLEAHEKKYDSSTSQDSDERKRLVRGLTAVESAIQNIKSDLGQRASVAQIDEVREACDEASNSLQESVKAVRSELDLHKGSAEQRVCQDVDARIALAHKITAAEHAIDEVAQARRSTEAELVDFRNEIGREIETLRDHTKSMNDGLEQHCKDIEEKSAKELVARCALKSRIATAEETLLQGTARQQATQARLAEVSDSCSSELEALRGRIQSLHGELEQYTTKDADARAAFAQGLTAAESAIHAVEAKEPELLESCTLEIHAMQARVSSMQVELERKNIANRAALEQMLSEAQGAIQEASVTRQEAQLSELRGTCFREVGKLNILVKSMESEMDEHWQYAEGQAAKDLAARTALQDSVAQSLTEAEGAVEEGVMARRVADSLIGELRESCRDEWNMLEEALKVTQGELERRNTEANAQGHESLTILSQRLTAIESGLDKDIVAHKALEAHLAEIIESRDQQTNEIDECLSRVHTTKTTLDAQLIRVCGTYDEQLRAMGERVQSNEALAETAMSTGNSNLQTLERLYTSHMSAARQSIKDLREDQDELRRQIQRERNT